MSTAPIRIRFDVWHDWEHHRAPVGLLVGIVRAHAGGPAQQHWRGQGYMCGVAGGTGSAAAGSYRPLGVGWELGVPPSSPRPPTTQQSNTAAARAHWYHVVRKSSLAGSATKGRQAPILSRSWASSSSFSSPSWRASPSRATSTQYDVLGASRVSCNLPGSGSQGAYLACFRGNFGPIKIACLRQYWTRGIPNSSLHLKINRVRGNWAD